MNEEDLVWHSEDLSNAEYHRSKHLGSSSIRASMVSIAHFLTPTKKSAVFDLGTAIHLALLEPERYKKNVFRAPDCRRGSAEWNKAIAQESSLAIPLKPESTATEPGYDDILNIQNNCFKRKFWKKTFDPNIPDRRIEHSYFWHDKVTGLALKCRPDISVKPPSKTGLLVDVKTCPNGKAKEADTFSRSVIDYGYHVQAAMYLEGISICTGENYTDFWIIAVEKTAPFNLNEFHMSREMLAIGSDIFHAQLRMIAEYKESGNEEFNIGYSEDTFETNGDIREEKEISPSWYLRRKEKENG